MLPFAMRTPRWREHSSATQLVSRDNWNMTTVGLAVFEGVSPPICALEASR